MWEEARFQYTVWAVWADTLRRAEKLPHDMHEEYVVDCREGVTQRFANIRVIKEQEKKRRIGTHTDGVIK